MSNIPTESRWELLNDPRLDAIFSEEQKEYLIGLISEDLGYGPPPQEELGEENEVIDTLPSFSQSAFTEVWHRGAGFSKRLNERKGIIFHHTGGRYKGSIAWMTKNMPRKTASYHVIIAPDGTQHRLVDDKYNAFHAGYGYINKRNPNHVCLGVAFEGDTVTGKHRDQRELTPIEIESAMDWIIPRWKEFEMSFNWSTDHRTVDPNRRNDLAPDQLNRLIEELKRRIE
jgi:AmpD protein